MPLAGCAVPNQHSEQPVLKVLHLASGDLWAGAEAQTFNMIRGLLNEPRVEVRVVLLNEGILADNLRAIGVVVVVLQERELGFRQLFGGILRIVREYQPQILHTHRYKENILGALAVLRLKKVRLVCTVHGLPEPISGLRLLKAKATELMNRLAMKLVASRVIAVSADIAAAMNRVAPKRVAIVGNSYEPRVPSDKRDLPNLRRSLGIPESHRIIGAIGRLVPVKGMDLFVDCAIVLAMAHKNLTFLLVGEGSERVRLERSVCQAGLKERILFTGFREDVEDVMALVDVVVIPSRHEGIPSVLLEALGTGKSVVATAVGGIPEVGKHNVNCILVEPEQPQEWGQKIVDILNNPKEAERLQENGKRDVMSRWGIGRQAHLVRQIYAELVGT